jgi:hypothetical protein
LTQSLAVAKTRRGVLAGLGALLLGARAAGKASAQSDCPIPGQTRNRKGDCNCPAGTNACPDGCFNLRRDLANCGRCGRSCTGGECVKGECKCPSGSVLCNGICRTPESFASDLDNCGGCNNACAAGDTSLCQGTGVCSGGACGFASIEGTLCGAEGTKCLTAERCDAATGSCPAGEPRNGGEPCNDSGAGEHQGYCNAGVCTQCQRGPNGGDCTPGVTNCCPGTTCRRNDSGAGPFWCRADD